MACVVGSILFWALCLGVNYARHAALALPVLAADTAPPSSLSLFFLQASYWILPKPMDCLVLLEQALQARAHMATLSALPEFALAIEKGTFDSLGAMLTAALFAGLMLAWAGKRLATAEY
jgi:hypothetical protein